MWGVKQKSTCEWSLCPWPYIIAAASQAKSRGLIGLWSAPLCGPLHSNCLGHQFQEPCGLQVTCSGFPCLVFAMWVSIFGLGSTTQKHPNYYCLWGEFPQIPVLGDIKLWECLPSANCDKTNIQSKAIIPSKWNSVFSSAKDERFHFKKHQWHQNVKLLQIVAKLIPDKKKISH